MIEWILENGHAIILVFVIIAGIILLASLLWPRNIIETGMDDSSGKRKMGVYYLPETLIELKVNSQVLIGSDKSGSMLSAVLLGQEYSLSTQVQADTSQAFVLTHQYNPFSISEIYFATNKHGLLENMKAISDNQTPEIFSFLAHAPTDTAESMKLLKVRKVKTPAKIEKVEIKNYERIFFIRIADVINKAQGLNQTWDIKVSSSDNSKAFKTVKADFMLKMNRILPPQNLPKLKVPLVKTSGLIFRIRNLFDIEIKSNTLKNTWNTKLNGLDPEFYYNVPVRSTPFVKRSHELAMLNGELVSHKINIPSAVEAFITIPVNIAKAIVSIPAQILSLRIDFTSKKKELAESIQSLKQTEEEINKQKALTKAESELAEIKIQCLQDLERLEHTNKTLREQLNAK